MGLYVKGLVIIVFAILCLILFSLGRTKKQELNHYHENNATGIEKDYTYGSGLNVSRETFNHVPVSRIVPT